MRDAGFQSETLLELKRPPICQPSTILYWGIVCPIVKNPKVAFNTMNCNRDIIIQSTGSIRFFSFTTDFVDRGSSFPVNMTICSLKCKCHIANPTITLYCPCTRREYQMQFVMYEGERNESFFIHKSDPLLHLSSYTLWTKVLITCIACIVDTPQYPTDKTSFAADSLLINTTSHSFQLILACWGTQ